MSSSSRRRPSSRPSTSAPRRPEGNRNAGDRGKQLRRVAVATRRLSFYASHPTQLRREGYGGPFRGPPSKSTAGIERVAAALVGPLLLRRIAAHERTHEHRVRRAADLVLDREEHLRGLRID